jgi:hypothetical protein
VSTLVESAQHLVESVTTAVESVVETVSVVALLPQDANTIKIPIAKITLFIFLFFLCFNLL